MARKGLLLIFIAILHKGGCAFEDGSVPQDAGWETAFPLNALCVEVGRRQSGDPVTLLPSDGKNECIEVEERFTYWLRRDETQAFRIYGIPYVEYCIGIKRTYGFITISHESGRVTREGNIFTWCVASHGARSESITVRSLTARAAFELLLL